MSLKWPKRLKDNKGFSLVEIVISIAILAVFSGIVLQLFLLSNTLSNRVILQDTSAAYMQSLLETFKQDPAAIKESSLLQNAIWAEQGENTQFELYFDKEFNILPREKIDQAAMRVSGIVGPPDAQEGLSAEQYPLPLSLTPGDGDPVCYLVRMEMQAHRIDKGEFILLLTVGTMEYVVPQGV